MSKKISLNPKYTNTSGYSWSTTTYNNLKYYISTNKNSNSVSTLKCEFTTPYDNIDVVVQIGSSSENNYDWCYIGKLDDSNPSYNSNYLNRVSGYVGNNYEPSFKTVTINVAKAGTHFFIIGYIKDGSGSYGKDCGYFRLDTTEVDSMERTKYIYCGTKTTVVSEKPIVFSKDGTTNDKFVEYNDPNNMFQWKTDYVDGNYYSTKVSFKTTSDNTEITLIYKYYFNNNRSDRFYVSFVDTELNFSSNDYIYQTGINLATGTVTKKISIPKAGDHYINIGFYFYRDSYVRSYVYVGFSGTNVITDTKILTPGNILANNKNIGKVYVGSELIWSKPLHNTISWETLTWDKNNNTYTYNSKGPLKMNYKNLGSSTSSSISLNTSPAEMPNNGQIDNITFDNGQSGIIQIMPYKIDLSDWDSTYVTNMNSMFNNCNALTSLDVSKWNVENVTSMNDMFRSCSALTSLDVSKWNTSSVTSMNSMFRSCSALTSLDLSKWNVGNVTRMSGLFNNCNALTSLDVSNLNVGNVTDMDYMFMSCSALTSLDLSKWNVGNVTRMNYMFYSCSALTSLDVSKWNVGNVTSMNDMFSWCSKLTSLDVSKWNVGNVIRMNNMFNWCSKLTSLDVSKWNVGNVTRMSGLFNNCNALTSLDVSNWNVGNVTDMDYMFSECEALTSLIAGHESEPNITALNGLKNDIKFKYSTKLNYESVYALFRGAATVTGKTITLPKVMQGKLDATKVKIATDKGWTIAYE